MGNELKIFENKDFGKVRTLLKDGEPYFVGKDVADILGYTNSRKAISDHVDDEDKGVTKCDTLGGVQELITINESGLYSLILSSKLPAAKAFKRWVTHEVLPAIRKTGGYQAKQPDNSLQSKRLDIMDRNSRARAAKLLLKIAERTSIKEYKEVCNAKAAAMVTGEEVLPMPEAERRTYSAKEIGKMFGVSANKIGKLANAHNLKKPEYGKLFYSKSEHSVKEVETWRYYETAIPVFAGIFGVKAVAV